MFVRVLRERWGKWFSLGGASEDYTEVCFVGLVVGGNYVWYLVIVAIFIGFGGAKRWEDVLNSSFGVAMEATRGQFLWGRGVLTR